MIYSQIVKNKLLALGIEKGLTAREADIIKRYYGIGHTRHTLEDIGKIYEVTRERIRQVKFLGLSKLGLNPKEERSDMRYWRHKNNRAYRKNKIIEDRLLKVDVPQD